MALSKTHKLPRELVNPQEAVGPSRHYYKIVDLDVNPQYKQNKILRYAIPLFLRHHHFLVDGNIRLQYITANCHLLNQSDKQYAEFGAEVSDSSPPDTEASQHES